MTTRSNWADIWGDIWGDIWALESDPTPDTTSIAGFGGGLTGDGIMMHAKRRHARNRKRRKHKFKGGFK